MIYVPNDSYACYVVQDANTIRAYHTMPYNPSYNTQIQVAYTDYYVNSHYIEKVGTQSFGYNTTLPTCINGSNLTTNFYYRNDFDSILIIFLIISLIVFVIPFKLFSRMFGRWLKI